MKKYVPICPKCDTTLVREEVSDGYEFECHECDEDFYEFEVKWREKVEIPTITEIRKHLKSKGATLTKLKMRLNGNDAYEVASDVTTKVYTIHELKEAFKLGAI